MKPKASEFAAVLPGEGDILAAVVAKPGDPTTRLVYADWLDERDDPRGTFLRKFVTAVQTGGKWPAARGLSRPWLEMIAFSLESRIRELDLTAHRDIVLSLAQPAVPMWSVRAPEKSFAIGATKMGGRPHLPRGSQWPTCDGGPLEFLAQFNLEEVSRTIAGRNLPASGLLSLFMYHNYGDDEYGDGKGRGYPGGLKLIYTPAGVELIAGEPADEWDTDEGAPRPPCRVIWSESLDVPRPSDDTWSKRFGLGFPTEFEGNRDLSLDPVWHSDHQLFGYARVTVLGGDPIPDPAWQLLVRFNSDDKLQWGWGDGHRLFWYIRTEDLHARRFDRTTAIDG